MADDRNPLLDRIAAALVAPFTVLGGSIFICLHFLLIDRVPWMQEHFSGKGSGPFGVIVAVLVGMCIGGFAGCRAIRWIRCHASIATRGVK